MLLCHTRFEKYDDCSKMKPIFLVLILFSFITSANGCQQPCLFVSNTTNILSVPASLDHDPVSVLSNLPRAVALDVHVSRKLIFWSDVSDKSIKRANTDGSNITVIVEDWIGVCDGLAVEWSTDLLYWTDTSFNKIEVAHLDGSRRRALISDNLDEPRGIAVDPLSGLMFWTDWGSKPKIESAYLNGENRQAIITSSLGWPNDIALDHTPKKIYWIDAQTDKIESADYSGTNRKQLFHISGIHPFGVVLLSQWLYWTDWRTSQGLHRLYKTGAFSKNGQISGTTMGITAFDSSVQPSTSNHCQQNNGGCSFLCLLKPNGYVCTCPFGMVLGNNNKTCSIPANGCQQPCLYVSNTTHILSVPASLDHHPVAVVSNLSRAIAIDVHVSRKMIFWSDVSDKSIRRANTDGSNITVIVEDWIGVCDGLAVEWSTDLLYWTDTTFNKIEVAHLDGSRRRVLISDNLDEPRGIAVDPMSGNMFWTDWGSNPKIESAYLNGENRQVIITSSLGWPNDIALDHTPKKIYWADAKTDKIESVDYSGTNRKQLFYNSIIHPFGVALLSQWLYWTDWNTVSGLHQMSKTTGDLTKKFHILSPRSRMGLAVFDSSVQPSTSNDCQQNNGGCSFICLLKPNGYTCVCPNGTTLGNDGKTCNAAAIVCSALTTPANAIKSNCHGQTHESSGTVCQFSCVHGYQPVIAQLRRCQSNGTWSGSTLVCHLKTVTCHPLASPKFGSLSPPACFTRGKYNDVCHFACSSGFIIRGTLTRTCGSDGKWTGQNDTVCKDIQRPDIRCPKNVAINTDAGKAVATHSWTVPVPHDNSGEILTVSVKPDGISSPHQFYFGKNVIRYTTKDSAGLQSGCSFVVTVQDVESPTKVKCPPYMVINSKKEYTKVYLPRAVFKDNVKVTNITTDPTNGTQLKWGDHKVTYTAYDQSGNTAMCILKITITPNPCQRPRPPANGVLACDVLHLSMQCTVHCNHGYEFVAQPRSRYMCFGNGLWFNDKNKYVTQPSIPDCSVASSPTAKLYGKLHYLTDNCDEQNPGEVIEKFKRILRTGMDKYFCVIYEGCKIDNIRVTCGDAAKQRRRSTDNAEKLSIHFQMKIHLPKNSSSDSINATLAAVKSSVLETINKSASHFEVNGVKLTLQSSTLKVVGLECTEGQVLKGAVCAGCPPGYYLAPSSKSCSPCPVNQYQENEGKTSCSACPSGTSTRDNTGSKSCLKDGKTGSQNKITSVVVPVVIPLIVVIILCVIGVVLFKRYRRPTLASADSDKQNVVHGPRTMSTDNPIYEPTTPDDHTYATITDSGMYGFQNKGYRPDVSKA